MISVAIDCRTFRIPTKLQDCTVVQIDTLTPLNYIHCYGALLEMTKFSPTGYPKEYLVRGVYFKSENDASTYYLIELCKGRFEGNALVKIYSTDIPDNHFDTQGLVNGSEIAFPEFEIEYVAEIDLYGKYFFPKFNNEMQLYYDDEKYYKGKCKTNSITSLFEAINYGIEYGLNKSGIVPY